MATNNTQATKVAPAATVAAPAPATVTTVPQHGKLPAGLAATTVLKLGHYSARTPVNVAAWVAMQAVGTTATAQAYANALATCPNITSNVMLAYMLTPNSKGIAALYAAK